MARTARTALIVALGGALLLAGCGRKGPLEPPGGAPAADQSSDTDEKPDEQKTDPDAAERVLKTPHKP